MNWIKVTVALPEHDNYVLTYSKHPKTGEEIYKMQQYITKARDWGWLINPDVTHWTPLTRPQEIDNAE